MTIQLPRWIQLIGLPIIIFLAWSLASQVTTAIFIFLSAAVIALILNPLVRWLEYIRVPRFIGVFIVYVAMFLAIVVLLLLLIPPVVEQLERLVIQINDTAMAETPAGEDAGLVSAASANNWRENIRQWLSQEEINQLKQMAISKLDDLATLLLAYSINLVGAITDVILVLIISIYMLLDAGRIGRYIRRLFPADKQADADLFVKNSQNAVTHWVRGQAMMCLLIGISSGLGIWFLGLVGVWPEGSQYVVIFGVWAGITELIPYVGPILGALPPIIVALFASPWAALAVLLLFVFIQQIEGHILVPNIMGSMVGVHPLVVIFAVLAGAEMRGVLGMVLALPLVALGREVIYFFKSRVTLENWRSAPLPVVEEDTGVSAKG